MTSSISARLPIASWRAAYAGFLDAYAESGRYRVRYFTNQPRLGGSPLVPLMSDWVVVDVVQPSFVPPVRRDLARLRTGPAGRGAPLVGIHLYYGWHARFHVQVNQPEKRTYVTIRIRLNGPGSSDPLPWGTAVAAAWGNRFKSCVDLRRPGRERQCSSSCRSASSSMRQVYVSARKHRAPQETGPADLRHNTGWRSHDEAGFT